MLLYDHGDGWTAAMIGDCAYGVIHTGKFGDDVLPGGSKHPTHSNYSRGPKRAVFLFICCEKAANAEPVRRSHGVSAVMK